MSFTGEETKVIFILVSINHNIGNDMDSGHCACDVLD